MIRKLFSSIIAVTTLMFGSVVFAQTGNVDVMNLPKLDQFVTDFAGVLDQSILDELNQRAYNYEQVSGHQFVAVLIPDRQGNELFDIALNIFNENQIGDAQTNDGLLLVIATDEKKIRIVVGYGLEGEMPDVLASKIIEENIRPLVNSGDFAGAVKVFYTRAEQAISSGEGKNMQSEEDPIDGNEGMIFAVAVFAYFFGRTFRAGRKAKKKKSSWLASGFISWIILAAAIIATVSILPLVVYIIAGTFGYIAGASFMFFPGGPRGGFSGGSKGGWGGGSRGGGGSFGGFSGGGGSSGGGGAGD